MILFWVLSRSTIPSRSISRLGISAFCTFEIIIRYDVKGLFPNRGVYDHEKRYKVKVASFLHFGDVGSLPGTGDLLCGKLEI